MRLEGNARWRKLSETHNAKGELVEPPTEDALRAMALAKLPRDTCIPPTAIRRWLSAFLPDVASGSVDLDELLAVVDEDLAIEPMRCPFCYVGWYRRSSGPGWQHGMCITCYLNRLRGIQEERLRELTARREVNALKTQIRRERDALDPDRPRHHPPFRRCDVCGDKLPPAKDYPGRTCVACLGRAEHHDRPVRLPAVRPLEEYDRPNMVGTNLPLGVRMLTCASCGFTRPATATDTEERCPDCIEREEARQARRMTRVMADVV